MTDKVMHKLKVMITEQLDVNIDQEEIDEDVGLFEEGLGLDSIAIMEFITLIEDNFGIQFGEDELNLQPFQNLRTLADFISEKQAAV